MKISRKINAVLVSLVFSVLAFGNSGSNNVRFNGWEVVGPTGGDIRAVAIDPRNKERLFVTTLDSQIYSSSDAGKTWKFLTSFSRPQIILDDLIIDTEDSNIIYVAGHRHKEPGGFYKSKDGGLTWKESKELKNEAIHGMTQSKTRPNMLFAGGVNGLWVSNNKGDDWKKIESKSMPINIDSVAVDHRNTDVIYVGTWWRAYKSVDAGKNWKLIKNGMIDDSDVFAIIVDFQNPDHIIASACSGIYESLNGGELWRKFPGIPSSARRTRTILQNPADSKIVYAGTTEGFWMTSNNGGSWGITTQKELEINGIAVHPEEPNKVYIATNNYGLMVSNDYGKSFVVSNGNFTSRFTHTITADVQNPNRFYATTNNTATGGGFVFVSNDSGQTWKQSTGNLSVIRVSPYALLQDKKLPNTIYLGTNQGVFRSLDRGVSWAQVKGTIPVTKKAVTPKGKGKKPPTPPTTGVKKVASITDIVNVLASANDDKNSIFAGTNKGLYRTSNPATGWDKLSFGAGIDERVFAVHSSPLMPNRIWVGTVVSGVLVSNDNGVTWKKVEGIPNTVPVTAVEIDPTNPDVIYVGTKQSFYVSRDGGQSWTRRGGNLPLGDYSAILINPNNPEEIFAGNSMEGSGGIFHSLDAGKNWKRVDSKDLNIASRRVWSIAFDPKNQNRLLVGTHSSGIYSIERVTETALTDNLTRPRVISPQ